MKIDVRARHVSITQALKEYAKKKLEKVGRFYEKIQKVTVELDISDTADENTRQIASITLQGSGVIVKASEASKDMYASIDLVLGKVEAQLKKHKEKIKDHKKGSGKRSLIEATAIKKTKKKAADSDKEENLYIPKPMAVEDAISIMEEQKQRFLVFRNIDTENINVIYPIRKDEYGLIET